MRKFHRSTVRRLGLATLVLALPHTAGAANAPRADTSPGDTPETASFQPARNFDPATISLRTLPNGVRGIVKETYGTDLVSVQVWVKAGSRYETEKNNGISYLIETLAWRASKNYPAAANGAPSGPAEALEALGGVTGSLTSRDSTFYNATVASPFLPAAVRAIADATLHPELSNAEVEAVKPELILNLQAQTVDPVRSSVELAYRAAFDQHPYGKPAAGTPASVQALDGEQVRAFHAARYAGSNISVVIVGDVRSEQAHLLIQRYFGEAPAAKAAPLIAPATRQPEFKTVTRRGFVPVGAVTLAFRSPGIERQDDVVAMDVLLSHWKEGSDAALRPVLLGSHADAEEDKEDETPPDETPPDETPPDGTPPNETLPGGAEKQNDSGRTLALAYDVDYLTQRDSGLFLITLVQPRNRVTALKATLDAIARVQNRGLDAADLERAKHALRSQYVDQCDTVSGQASSLGFYDMIDNYDFAVTYLDRIARVRSEDVQRVAKRYLSLTRYVEAAITPALPVRPRPPQPLPGADVITARYEVTP